MQGDRDEQFRRAVLRKQAMIFVDFYIEVGLSKLQNAEIAKEGRSVIGALVDFRGEIPRSSGFSEFCKLANKVDRMKRFGGEHLAACYFVGKLSDRQHDAVVCNQTYRGKVKVAIDPFAPEKPIEIRWTDEKCAKDLRCTVNTFRQRIVDGYTRLEGLIEESQGKKKAA
jgi:hypothetical protein